MNKTMTEILLELGHDQDEIEQMNVTSVGTSAFTDTGVYALHGRAIKAGTVQFKIAGIDAHNFQVMIDPYASELMLIVAAQNLPTYTAACRYIENLVNALEG